MTAKHDVWGFPAGWQPARMNPIKICVHRNVQALPITPDDHDPWGIPRVLLSALNHAGDTQENGDATRPALRFYAVMDGAMTRNLPEMLAVSGLAHRCLFTGAALLESGAVAPWLVEIAPENRFVRRLFTQGHAPWMLWDKSPGFFLATPDDFDSVWKHLRKLTRLRDADGIWHYFRFWDRIAAKALARASEIAPNAMLGLTAPFQTILMKVAPDEFISLHRAVTDRGIPVRTQDLIAIVKPIMIDIKLREDVAVIAQQICARNAAQLTERLHRWALLGFRNGRQLTRLGEFENASPTSLLDQKDMIDIIRHSGANALAYAEIVNRLERGSDNGDG